MIEDLSLGWQTDLIFARFDGLVAQAPDCVVVRSPSNPLYYWGNCLILPEPPRDPDLAHWRRRFIEEIGALQAESRHVAIGFDASQPHAPLASWRDAGFELFSTWALRLTRDALREPKGSLPADFSFKAFELPTGIEQAVDLQCEIDAGEHEMVDYREHRKRQMLRYQAMQEQGLGHWFGLWHGQTLVADCGLFRQGTLGRFQHVGTHPSWRRRGLCSALIHAVCHHGFERMGLQDIVICADPEDVALGLYESLGFRRVSQHWGAHLRPPAAAQA